MFCDLYGEKANTSFVQWEKEDQLPARLKPQFFAVGTRIKWNGMERNGFVGRMEWNFQRGRYSVTFMENKTSFVH